MIRRPTHPGVRPRTLLMLAVLVLTSCQTAYYAAMEKLGYPKRDLLVSRMQQARDSQQAAKEQFQSALEHFRAVVHFRGGELEAKYNELSAELERSESRAQTVHQRIATVEDVAEALFKEWEAELAQYTHESLRRASARQLAQTRQRYMPLIRTMKGSVAKLLFREFGSLEVIEFPRPKFGILPKNRTLRQNPPILLLFLRHNTSYLGMEVRPLCFIPASEHDEGTIEIHHREGEQAKEDFLVDQREHLRHPRISAEGGLGQNEIQMS